jgi:hypothetical protein
VPFGLLIREKSGCTCCVKQRCFYFLELGRNSILPRFSFYYEKISSFFLLKIETSWKNRKIELASLKNLFLKEFLFFPKKNKVFFLKK